MLFAWYGQAVGGFFIFAITLPLLVSLILHAWRREYVLVVSSTTAVTFIVWLLLGIVSEDGITSASFNAILFVTVITAIVSAVAGAPFVFVRRRQQR